MTQASVAASIYGVELPHRSDRRSRLMTINLTGMHDAQQQYLDYLDVMKNGQKALADALQSWGGAFEDVVGQPASLWSLEPVPPRELVETTFGFVERLLAAQKQLAIALVDTAVSEVA
jgi:hypothetical protein